VPIIAFKFLYKFGNLFRTNVLKECKFSTK